MEKVAVVTDSRGGYLFHSVSKTLDILDGKNIDYKIMFFECSDEVLYKRYKETRGKHPLSDDCEGSVMASVWKEKGNARNLKGTRRLYNRHDPAFPRPAQGAHKRYFSRRFGQGPSHNLYVLRLQIRCAHRGRHGF